MHVDQRARPYIKARAGRLVFASIRVNLKARFIVLEFAIERTAAIIEQRLLRRESDQGTDKIGAPEGWVSG